MINKITIVKVFESNRRYMNPKNIEQYVVKNIVACMDFEKGMKSKVENLEQKVKHYEEVLRKYGTQTGVVYRQCSYEGCNTYALQSRPLYNQNHNVYIMRCDHCNKYYCETHMSMDADAYDDDNNGLMCVKCWRRE